MIQHIGDEFEGIVSSVANFGMFIELLTQLKVWFIFQI